MIKTVEKFCSEKRLRFGYGFEGGLNDFFSMDANGVYVIIGRPKVGVTEGDVVLRGNAVAYRDELAAMLGRNGNKVSRSDNRLHVVFRIARPMSSGGTGYQPTPPTPPTPSVTPLYFEAKQANSTVSMMSNLATAPDIEYSTDGGTTFQAWNSTQQDNGGGQIAWLFDTITLGTVGDKVYFKGTNAALSDFANGKLSIFMPTGNVKVGGSVQSLVDGTGESTTAIKMELLFADMMNTGALTEVESGLLPATTLTDYCYNCMFQLCTSLTSAPTLPATTLAEGCYTKMFDSCTSLTSAPTLPATTLEKGCYRYMFDNCTSLTSAPTLPVTTLADECYKGMFYGCTALTTAPTLPATTLAEGCYHYMFQSCTALASVTCLATDISATDCVSGWLHDVAASGTLYKSPSMTGWVEGTNYPNGWTLTDYAG